VIKSPKSVPTAPPSPPTAPHQLNITFDSVPLRAMSPSERAKVLVNLASLLMQAAGAVTGEHDDDEH
jgi:hypothetical protein